MKRVILASLLSSTSAFASSDPIECKYEGDIYCNVIADNVFVNEAKLNRGNCQDPEKLAQVLNEIRASYLATNPPPDQLKYAGHHIKDYRGAHKFGDELEIKVHNTCNLLEFTITVDDKPYTWKVHEKNK